MLPNLKNFFSVLYKLNYMVYNLLAIGTENCRILLLFQPVSALNQRRKGQMSAKIRILVQCIIIK